MTRDELERLDRDGLIARARAAGVARPGVLTRAELVDEILLRGTPDPVVRRRARGFFGIARDLLASVVELGLNRPDAAERIRTFGEAPLVWPSAPAALPTVTLAEIYAAQGHRDRAVETLEGVLAREPEHATARDLVGQLREGKVPVPPPRIAPEEDVDPTSAARDPDGHAVPPGDAFHVHDDARLPACHDVDECVAIPVDSRTLYVYWEVRAATLEDFGMARPDGGPVLRLLVLEPTWDGPRSTTRDQPIDGLLGDTVARDLPAGCVVRAAIGWKNGSGFAAIAHSPALETPPGAPLVRWTRTGAVPVKPSDPDAASIKRALELARRAETIARLATIGGEPLELGESP